MPAQESREEPISDSPQGSSVELVQRYQAGDDDAAEAIFHRYLDRLTRLARSRLSARLAARTDPEDVVLSAWRSFFIGARQGKYALKRSGDLWRLLASITMHKLSHQARRHTAERRSVNSEQSLENLLPAVDQEPTPAEAIALADELEAVMSSLDSTGRRVLELRLQGETLASIADETRRSERTVRRLLEQIQDLMRRRFEVRTNE